MIIKFSATSLGRIKVDFGDDNILVYRCTFKEDMFKSVIKVETRTIGTNYERWIEIDTSRFGADLMHYSRIDIEKPIGYLAGKTFFTYASDGNCVYHNFDNKMIAEKMGKQMSSIELKRNKFEGWILHKDTSYMNYLYGFVADCILYGILSAMYSKSVSCLPVLKLVNGYHWDGERLTKS